MCYEYEIAEAIGADGLKQLQRHFKSDRLYIPRTMHAEHKIARTVGLEAAKKLSAEFPCCLLNISRSLLVRERNENITMDRQAGAPPELIATKYGLTARSIRYITQGLNIKRARPRYGLRARNLRKVLQGLHDERNRQQQAQSHG